MNRLQLLLSRVAFGAILLFLLSSSAVFAQVTYTLAGTLNLVPGDADPLSLSGTNVNATATLAQSLTPTSSVLTSTSSANTYTGVTVGLQILKLGTANFPCDASTVSVTLTENVGAPDTIAINNCTIFLLGSPLATLSATATIPDGHMISAVPANIPLTTLTSGTVGVNSTLLNLVTAFTLTNATIVATGTAPPTVTPSPVAWTPTAPLGSAIPLSQPVTFTTVPSPAADAVSFTTSVATTPPGGTWLSVSPAAANTSSPITIKVDPTGLTLPSYTGTVTLTYGQGLSTQIPVTFTLSAPAVTLGGPASMTFNYTIGTTPPASQPLSITATVPTTVNAAVTSGNSWLSVTPASGTTPAGFTVSVNTAGLTASTLNGNIQITATGVSNSPFNIPVTFNVSSSTLTVPSTPLTFNYTIGGSAPTAQSVNATGTSGISFTTDTGAASAWLSATPSGTVPTSISVSINPAGLAALSVGPHAGTVTVTSTGATGSPASIPVTLNVIAPVLTATPSPLNFSYQLGSATQPVAQLINVGDSSGVSFTATPATTSGGSWLSVTPGSGNASGSLSVSVNTTGLAANTYNGTVTIAAAGATSQIVNVTLTVTQPTITVGNSSLNFAFLTGGTTPAAQPVTIGGTSGLAFTATPATTSGGSWLSVTPTSGSVSGSSSVSISVNTTGLAANTYTGTVTIAATGATSQVINVTLTVTQPVLTVGGSSLNFAFLIGGTAPTAQSVTLGGTSGLAFTATPATTSGGSWLSVSPGAGSISGSSSVSISVNTTGLAANTYTGTVTISAPGVTSQVVNVTLTVTQPTVTVGNSSLNFAFQIGGTAPAAQPVTIGGTSGLTFTATPATTSGGSWLSVTPGTGTISGASSISVSVNTTGLAANTYTGTVTVTAPGATTQVINVTFIVSSSPTISANPSSLNFAFLIGGTAPAAQPVSIGGSSALAFTATPATTSGGSWLSVTPGTGTVSGSSSVSVSVNTTGLAANTYTGTITITATGAAPQVVNVTLTVTQPVVTVGNSSLNYSFQIGATPPAAQVVTIGGTSSLGFTATPATTSGGSWLSVTPGSGSISGSSSVSISVNTTGLTANTYTGTVTIAATGATSQVINVTLTVTKPTLTATPSPLNFAFTIGGTAPTAQAVAIGGTSGLAFSAAAATTSGGSWLAVTPGSGTVSGSSSVSVSVNTSGLAANTYTGTVTITAPGATTQVVNVTLVVSAQPTVTAAPSSLNFAFQIGATAPTAQSLNIGGTATTFNAVAATTSGGSWLSVTPGSGPISGSSSVSVSVNTTGLAANTYTGTITISATGATSQVVNVTLTVTQPVVTAAPSSLNFAFLIGGTAPAAQPVTIGGTSALTFNAVAATTSGGSWLSVTPGSGPISGSSSVSVSVNTTGLAANTYTGTITISATGATSQVVNVTLTVTQPTVTAAPTSLNFAFTMGGTAPAAQPLAIGGTAGLTFTAAAATVSGGAWLAVTPGSGPISGSSSASVSVNTTGLAANTYTGTVTISATGATPQVVNVTLVVSAQPTLTVGNSSLNFAFQIGATAPTAQSVTIGGTATTFTATPATTSGGSWLSVTPGTGPLPATGSVSISVNTAGLTANTYNGTVTVASTGATSQVINVTLVVTKPTITATPTPLNFAFQIGGTAPVAQPVAIGGTLGLAFTATPATTSGGAWLVVTPGSGTISASSSLSVSVNTTGLTANTYNGTVTVAGPGATSQVVNVTLVITSAPAITASPSSFTFNFTIGGTAPLSQALNLGVASGLDFTVAASTTSGGSWLSVSPGSGTGPALLGVSVDTTGLKAATYHGNITVTAVGASNSPLAIPVTFVVTAGVPPINLSALTLNFSAVSGGASPANQTVHLASSPSTPVSISSAGGSWLSASLSATTTPAVVTVSVNPADLTEGTFSGTVTVTGGSTSPQSIAVQLVVTPKPSITAAPTSLSFAVVLGSPNPAAKTVSVTSTQPVSFSVSSTNAAWLTVNSSGTTPGTLTASVNQNGLSAGTFQANISITSAEAANSPLVVPVTFVVSNKPTLSSNPTTLTFTAQTGAANPASQSIALSSSSAVPFTITTSPSWLSVSASTGTTPSTLVTNVNSQGMPEGSYQGAITITSGGAGNSPVTIGVTLSISKPLVTSGPTIASVVSGASFDTSGFSGGAIVTIFGSLLGPQTGVGFGLNSLGGLDDTLAGVVVTVDGVRAIPLFVQDGQVNIILPFGLGASGQAKVEVQYNDLTSADFSIPLAPADVQIFTANASGSGPGSILNSDYSVNTADNPAAKGSFISVYGTGGGPLNPVVTVGGIAGSALSWVTLPYSATINGEDVKVLYAGTAPSLVFGVYQFNILLPADLPSGANKIAVKVGDSTSQSNVTVFVK